MRISILVENTNMIDHVFQCENGLSFFIEFQGKNYLLDAGTTGAFIENAKLLGVPIADVETCILSHGHYDHSGGFGVYLRENKNAKLYMMNSAIEPYFSGSRGYIHEIGVPKNVIEEHKERFVLVEGKIFEIEEHVYIVPHNTPNLQQIAKRAKLYRKVGENYELDDFSHELSLVFDTPKGLIILNSCSHGGLKNIIREVQEALPNKTIYAFLGGLHMKGKQNGMDICEFTEEEIKELVTYVNDIQMKYLYTGHCTGAIGLELLKKHGGELVCPLTTGQVIIC